MLDGFARSHPPIVLTDDRPALHERTFEEIRGICNDTRMEQVPFDLFSAARDAHTQTLHVELHLQRLLHQRNLAGRPRLDELLLSIILLHRLKNLALQDVRPRSTRAALIMGTMIQHRLVELLLGVDPRQRTRIFGLGKFRLLKEELWGREFTGASAVARVIKGFYEIDETVLRLPTVEEDLEHGIDLYVEAPTLPSSGLRDHLRLAISIKSTAADFRLMAEHVTRIIPDGNGVAAEQERILSGARTVSQFYRRRFLPARIRVGRPIGKNYDLSLQEVEIVALERLLGRVELSLGRASRTAIA